MGLKQGSSRRIVLVVATLAAALSLAACTHAAPQTSAPSVSSGFSGEGTSSPAPTVGPTAPNLDRALFDEVNRAVVAEHQHPLGADFTTALQNAGFARGAMQLTADRTSIGLEPGSIQFSVRVGQECFIGQYGSAVGGYRSEVVPPLATGGCLIGDTVHVP